MKHFSKTIVGLFVLGTLYFVLSSVFAANCTTNGGQICSDTETCTLSVASGGCMCLTNRIYSDSGSALCAFPLPPATVKFTTGLSSFAISGSLLTFPVTVTNNSSGLLYFRLTLPLLSNYQIDYVNASESPLNNFLLSMGMDHNPVFSLNAGQTKNLVITGIARTTDWTFPLLDFAGEVSDDPNITIVYGVATGQLRPMADIAVKKSFTGTAPSLSGDTVRFLISLQNIGSASVPSDVNFWDEFPLGFLGLPTVSFDGMPHPYDRIELPNKLRREGELYLSVNPGQKINIVVSAKLRGNYPIGTQIVNTGGVLVFRPQLSGPNDMDWAFTSIVPYVDLSFSSATMGSSQPQISGDAIAFTVNYGYFTGNMSTTGVNLLMSISGTNISGILYPLGTLTPGTTGSITITGTMKDNYIPGTPLCLQAAISSADQDANTGNNTLAAPCYSVSPISDLILSGNISSSVNLDMLASGSQFQYTITLTNTGTAIATGITVTQILPSQITSLSGNTITWTGLSLNPGATLQLTVNGIINTYPPSGMTLVTTGTVTSASREKSLANNQFVLTSFLGGLADVYVNQSILPISGYKSGSLVTYIINYGNSGGKTASGVTITDAFPSTYLTTPTTSRTLNALAPGQTGQITLVGVMKNNLSAGQLLVNQVNIGTTNIQFFTGNDSSTITGVVPSIDDVSIDMIANNLTRTQMDNAPYGSNPSTLIGAIEGDSVRLTIFYSNNGNLNSNSVLLSLAGLNGFTTYSSFNGTLGTLAQGQTGTLVITGIIGPRNFVSFSPIVTLTYNTTGSKTKTLTIQEPMICGDGLLTRTEECDTGTGGNLSIGQVCENQGGTCTIVTKFISNTACISYTYFSSITGVGSGQSCSSANSPIVQATPPTPTPTPSNNQCKVRSLDGNLIITEEDAGGKEVGYARVMCEGTGQGDIAIDCGDGNGYNSSVYASHVERVCKYNYNTNSNNNDHAIKCKINNQNSCDTSVYLDQGSLGDCGNGKREGYEQCDDGRNNGTSSSNCDVDCKLKGSNLPACLYINNGNISVQEGEIMPFRWKLDTNKNPIQTSCTKQGAIEKGSTECTFMIGNGKNNNTWEQTLPCDQKASADVALFSYFKDLYPSFNSAFGRFAFKVNDFANGMYGEYKLTLKSVSYNYCTTDTNGNLYWKQGVKANRICEVNFAVTKPYLAQKSAFGLTPKSTTINLDNYYDINGNELLSSTDLDKIMVLSPSDYAGGTQIKTMMKSFISKYQKLAVKIDKLPGIKIPAEITALKKVPNQNIYIFEGKGGTLTFNGAFSQVPFTIITQGLSVVVKGDLTTNGMFLVNGGNILFDAPDENKCGKTQEVRGIFVTDKSFTSPKLNNSDIRKSRCEFGGLYVKGVLIGNGIETLVQQRRSQLNSWFYATSDNENSIKAQRRNKIFNGAAVEIEYSPSLRDNLPPGASEFTKALEVYKK